MIWRCLGNCTERRKVGANLIFVTPITTNIIWIGHMFKLASWRVVALFVLHFGLFCFGPSTSFHGACQPAACSTCYRCSKTTGFVGTSQTTRPTEIIMSSLSQLELNSSSGFFVFNCCQNDSHVAGGLSGIEPGPRDYFFKHFLKVEDSRTLLQG